MSQALNKILETFSTKLDYRERDRKALDLSRSAAAGNLGDSDYSEWALITNDPVVVINYVKTFITILASKLSASPLRPQSDELNDIVTNIRLNAKFTELYQMTLSDGYAFLGLGLDDEGQPIANIIDARSVLFNGNDPTLKDSTELIVFEVLPRTSEDTFVSDFPTGYVEYDSSCEKVRASYYHKTSAGVTLAIYNEGDEEEPVEILIPNVDRIPVVRFFGEKFELADKRWHYRGLYYQLAGVIKATALAATKLQVRVATTESDNWICTSDAIANDRMTWKNSGVKILSDYDSNGQRIDKGAIPIPHNDSFLIEALNTWKSVTSDMLGPVVQSSSEAVTREEVLARNEVRDAISNTYLSNMADSVAEVYRIINSMMFGETGIVVVQGGVIEAAKRQKNLNQLTTVYGLAKESGLNAQGFILEILASSELPLKMRQRLGQLLLQDPFASPQVKQLQQQAQMLQQTIQKQQTTITQLRIMASQRMERQAEWVASQERIKRFELMFKQWQQENKDTQEARMEIMRKLLDVGDTAGAMAMLQAIKSIDTPVLIDPVTQHQMDEATLDAAGLGGQYDTNFGTAPIKRVFGQTQDPTNQFQINQPVQAPNQAGI